MIRGIQAIGRIEERFLRLINQAISPYLVPIMENFVTQYMGTSPLVPAMLSAAVASQVDSHKHDLVNKAEIASALILSSVAFSRTVFDAVINGIRLTRKITGTNNQNDNEYESNNQIDIVKELTDNFKMIAAAAISAGVMESMPEKFAFQVAFDGAVDVLGVPDSLKELTPALKGAIVGGVVIELLFLIQGPIEFGTKSRTFGALRNSILQVGRSAIEGATQCWRNLHNAAQPVDTPANVPPLNNELDLEANPPSRDNPGYSLVDSHELEEEVRKENRPKAKSSSSNSSKRVHPVDESYSPQNSPRDSVSSGLSNDESRGKRQKV